MKDFSTNELAAAKRVVTERGHEAAARRKVLIADLERVEVEIDLLNTILSDLCERMRHEEEANPCK